MVISTFHISAMSECQYKTLGFIGLGAMGWPMAGHLADKLPQQTKIYVFDVVGSLMDDLCAKYPKKVSKAKNARDVAEKSVRVKTAATGPDNPETDRTM